MKNEHLQETVDKLNRWTGKVFSVEEDTEHQHKYKLACGVVASPSLGSHQIEELVEVMCVAAKMAYLKGIAEAD